MNGAWLNVDRGYNDPEFLDYTASINLNVFFTKKRGADIPWKFGRVGYKGQEQQINLPEKGTQHVWEARKSIGSTKKLYLVAYRNGTGRIILYVSTS